MHVVYDTNVLVRIFARRGELLAFRRMLLEQRVMLITSSFILCEAEAVLALKFGLTRQKAKTAVRLIARMSVVVEPDAIEPISRDPDDDFVLAAAVKGGADYLVTADHDLLALTHYHSVKIISPTDFAQLLRKVRK